GEDQKTQVVQNVFNPTANQVIMEGYVDDAGIIQTLPDWVDDNQLVAYTTEEEARNELNNGTITAYYIVPVDYLNTGEVKYVRPDFNPLVGFDQSVVMEQVLRFNLLGGEGEIYQKYQNPVNFNYINLQPQVETRDQDNALTFFLPYGVTMLFYGIMLSSASILLSNITKEKENRIIEILMVSLKPIQLFTGKILSRASVGLIQVIVWFGSGLLILRLGGTTLNIPRNLMPPPSLFFWVILFFLLGFGLYGSLMAGIGAMVPNLREASQATFIVIVPIIIPLMMISATINKPNGMAAIILSLIPFTAPVAMMTRLSAGAIPLWQPILSAFLLLGTVILTIRGVAKLFQTQTLLTGQKFSAGLFIKALFKRS
ncbi:MAG: ABC transporter permease, partial [Anaerolineaceae bacterium]|nr:ABC transporter permease [Anaerolineaceae bacterium]